MKSSILLLSLTAHPQSPHLLLRGPISCRPTTCSQSQSPEIQPLTRTLQIQTSASFIALVAFLVCRNDSAGKDTQLRLVPSSHCDMREPILSKNVVFFFSFLFLLIKGKTYFTPSWKPQSSIAKKVRWQECVRHLVPWHLWSRSKRQMLLLSLRSLYIHLYILSSEMILLILRTRLSMLINPT